MEAPELMADAAVEVADEDAVVASVRDRDAPAPVRGDLARKGEGTRRLEGDRPERRAGREIAPALEEVGDDALERRTVPLARRHRDHVAVGVDDDQRRPRADPVLLPRLQL